MSLLTIDSNHPLEDLIDARNYLDVIIRRRQGEKIDAQIAAGITGTPLDLKKGAPENKLAHLVNESKGGTQEGLPFEQTTAEQITEAAIARAAEVAPPAPAPAAAEAPKTRKPRTPKPEVVKTFTLDEVRAVMSQLASKGVDEQHRQRNIVNGMGYQRLSEIPPERLNELMAKVKGEWKGE